MKVKILKRDEYAFKEKKGTKTERFQLILNELPRLNPIILLNLSLMRSQNSNI